jgi:hypothetical protein
MRRSILECVGALMPSVVKAVQPTTQALASPKRSFPLIYGLKSICVTARDSGSKGAKCLNQQHLIPRRTAGGRKFVTAFNDQSP